MAERAPAALDVVGQVLVEMGGLSARIEARGDRIVVLLPGLRSGVASLRQWGRGRGLRESVRRIHEALSLAGLTLEVVIGNATVGLLGVGARPGLLSRVLGFDPLEIRVGGVLGSWRGRADRPG